ncbi:hypothetical protein HOB30_00165 [Candidatus Falkowbacteria bacterium]|jgi:hypothetical protein|nr:hypothetical protein [Candidatus Falkowbacteria bacterium]
MEQQSEQPSNLDKLNYLLGKIWHNEEAKKQVEQIVNSDTESKEMLPRLVEEKIEKAIDGGGADSARGMIELAKEQGVNLDLKAFPKIIDKALKQFVNGENADVEIAQSLLKLQKEIWDSIEGK